MQVGDLLLRIVAKVDGAREAVTAINSISQALLSQFKPQPQLTAFGQQLTSALDVIKNLQKGLNTQTAAGSIVSGFLSLVQAAGNARLALERLNPAVTTVQRVLGGLGTIAARPFISLAQAALSAVNPMNLVNAAISTLQRVGNIAFGVALGNAFSQLTRQAFEFINALSPLTTGLLSGNIDTALRALSVTAANSGKSFEEVSDAVNVLRASGIKAGEAIQSISQGLQIGLKPEQVNQLARAAQDLGVVIGQDSTSAFNRLFRAVVTGQSEMLRFAGIMKTSEQIIADFARAHGKSAAEVRSNTLLMRQAFVEGILAEASKFSGVYEASLNELGKRIGSFSRVFEDLQLGIGQIFTPILSGGLGGVEELVEQFSRLFFVTKKQSGDNYGSQLAKDLTAANQAQAELSGSTSAYTEVSKLTQKQVFSLSAAFEKFKVTSTVGGDAAVKAQEELDKAIKKVADQTGATESQLRELGNTGKFAFDTIIKEGNAFDPSPLTIKLYSLNKALGQLLEEGLRGSIKKAFGGVDFNESVDNAIDWGINLVAGFSNGLLSGINDTLIPALNYVAEAVVAFLGVASPTEQGPLSVDQSEWGANLTGAFADGITSGQPAVAGAAEDIASTVAETLDPETSPILNGLQEYGRNISRKLLEGFKLSDFSELNSLSGIIKSLIGGDGKDAASLKQAEAARDVIAQALYDIRTNGSLAESTLGQLQNSLGGAFGDFVKYFNLLAQVTDEEKQQTENEKKLAEGKKAIAEAEDKVREATERLRQFEADTSDIPERYTRGRRRQLEEELNAARQEEEKRKLAQEQLAENIRNQQETNKNIKDQLALQKALIQELARQAEAQARINKLTQEQPQVTPIPPDFTKRLDELAGNLSEKFRDKIIRAFAPVREEFEKLVAFVNGLLGKDLPLPEGFNLLPKDAQKEILAQLDPAYKAGKNLSEALSKIGGSVSNAFDGVLKFFADPNVKYVIDKMVEFANTDAGKKIITFGIGGLLLNSVTGGAAGSVIFGILSALFTSTSGLAALLAAGITIPILFTINTVTQGALFDDLAKFFKPDTLVQGTILLNVLFSQNSVSASDKIKIVFKEIFDYLQNTEDGLVLFLTRINIPLQIGKVLAITIQGIIAGVDLVLNKFAGFQTPQWLLDVAEVLRQFANIGDDLGTKDLKIAPQVQAKDAPGAKLFGNMAADAQRIYGEVLGIAQKKGAEIAQAVKDFTTDPTIATWQSLYDVLVGNSIIPDMLDEIFGLFVGNSNLVTSIVAGLSRNLINIFSNTVRVIIGFVVSLVNVVAGSFASISRVVASFVNTFNISASLITATMIRIRTAISTTLLSVQSLFFNASSVITQTWTQMIMSLNFMNNLIVTNTTNMINRVINGFKALYDILVGNSIIPDLADEIVGEFAALNPRTAGQVEGFKQMIENQMGSIDAGLNIAIPKGALNAKGGDSRNITIDQSGWVFPSNMDAAQQAIFRRLAREEAYAGIIKAFQPNEAA